MNLSTIFFNSEAMGSKSPVLFCWAKRNSRQHYKTIILGERGEVDKSAKWFTSSSRIFDCMLYRKA